MKLTARDIDGFVAQPGKSAGALIYGLDGGMVRQRVTALSASYLGKNADPMAMVELTAEQVKEDPALLADELAAFSLMAPKRVILLRDAEDSIVDAVRDALAGRAASNSLIAYAVDSMAGSKLRAFAESAADFAALPCYKDEGAGLETVIRDALKGYGLRAEPEVIRFLSAQLSGDRQIILNELEKLSLYIGDEAEQVTMDDAHAAIAENNDRGFDDLAHAVAAGNIVGLCRLSDRLLDEGNVGLLLVRAVMRHIRTLQQIANRPAGQSIDAALETMRPPVFFKVKPLLKSHAARWDAQACAQALAKLQILELDSKRYHEQSHARLAHGLMDVAGLGSNSARNAA
ncbi:MAG: DNA polymerase III subunit delta [Rhodospirillales bacterium 12-54-5]|nr:MAG: DNA polymerase III subunit delta [Rhodospirillales bacterium 12-54-5]